MKKIIRNSVWLLCVCGCIIFLSAYKNKHRVFSTAQIEKSFDADLETLRKRIVDDLLQPKIDETKIQRLITTLQADGSWPGINYVDTSRTGFQHAIHLENMLDLARAYKKGGNKFYQNPAVKKTLSLALDFWIAHDFICQNWWWNEMGTPNWMINTLLVFDTGLTEKQKIEGARIASRASLTGVGARAGGDFVPITGMIIKRGLFQRNDSIIRKAFQVMVDQIKITTDRGIKPDLSFHHRIDNVTSIHTYGTNYVSSFAYWTVKTAGTKYQLPEEALKLLIDYYLDGISKSMAFGMYTDPGAKNRDLSRKGDLDLVNTDIPENFIKSSNYRRKELEDLIKIRKGQMKPNQTWNRYYWWSSYFAHQRKNYYTSVRMHSTRQNNMEEPYNEEGLKMHHLADGSNFITRTGKEYYDIFPVWDWQKIPGATIVQKASLPHWREIAKKGLSDFVGGVSDGEFGAAAFDFRSVHDPLKARKAWFFFDKEYVCLGNSIVSESDYPVATTLNQCLLNGKVVVKTKAEQGAIGNGDHALNNASWVHHDSVGYLFLSPTSVNLFNKNVSGTWRSITHQARSSDETVEKNVFGLWIDHGIKPTAANYAYVVIPAISSTSLDQYSKKNGIVVLANTAEVQAVQNKDLNIAEIVFYKEGSIKLNSSLILSSNQPCILLIKLDGRDIKEIAISDPTAKLNSVQLSVNIPVNASGQNWKSLWDANTKQSLISIDLPKAEQAGKSVILKMKI